MIIDIHCHTRYGSPCSYMSPEEMIEQAVRARLDGICITEHDIPWEEGAIKKLSDRFGILVIGGMEISTEYGEVLVFGLTSPTLEVRNFHELRRRVDRDGGIMFAAHPFRGANNLVDWDSRKGLLLKTDEAMELPILKKVDGLEVFNGMGADWELELCSAVCDRLAMRGVGGSDAHNVKSVGDCVTALNKTVENEKDFLEELKAGRYTAQDRVRNRTYPVTNGEQLVAER